jgi:hypothetical protein
MGIFDTLHRASRRNPGPIAQEAPSMSAAYVRAAALGPWASDPACTETFLPYLEYLVALADVEESQSVQNHALMAVAQGKREALMSLRDEFLKWRDKP